ncbi:MAG: cytochrome c [Sphingomonadaceae bacterium]|nr:cytochrome c [Sphingomonadaceae bacterium]
MRKFVLLAGASLALAACSAGEEEAAAPAAAEAADTEEGAAEGAAAELAAMPTEALSGESAAMAMHDRHEWFEELGDAFKVLMRASKSDAPDMAAVKEATALAEAKSNDLPGLFAPGTGPDAGKTEAKANIWESPDDFMAKAKDFQVAAAALNAAAQADDVDGFKAAFGKTGGTCKACHDTYREED